MTVNLQKHILRPTPGRCRTVDLRPERTPYRREAGALTDGRRRFGVLRRDERPRTPTQVYPGTASATRRPELCGGEVRGSERRTQKKIKTLLSQTAIKLQQEQLDGEVVVQVEANLQKQLSYHLFTLEN